MSVPPMISVAIPIAMPIPGVLREDVLLPVRAKIPVSVVRLRRAISCALGILYYVISAIAETRTIDAAIHVSLRELTRLDRRVRARVYVARAKFHRSRHLSADRREALAGINRSVAAKTSHRH